MPSQTTKVAHNLNCGTQPMGKTSTCPHCRNTYRNLQSHITKSHRRLRLHSASASSSQTSDDPVPDVLSTNTVFPVQTPLPDQVQVTNIQDVGLRLSNLRSSVPTLRHVPRGARPAVAEALTEVIHAVSTKNDLDSWVDLMLFPYAVIPVPQKSDKVHNVTAWVKRRVQQWRDIRREAVPNPRQPTWSSSDHTTSLSKKVEAKLSDGDVRGAIRLISSEDVFATPGPDTIESLLEKHPSHPSPTSFPAPREPTPEAPEVSSQELHTAIRSFAPGSAGGLDGLRPQIVKDLLSCHEPQTRDNLETALISFMGLITSGLVNKDVRPLIFGASLSALAKKNGGIRPIAVGNVWRRLAAKIWCDRIKTPLAAMLAPHQLGVGIAGGAEAGAHTARIYHTFAHDSPKAFLKLDFRNAFNELRRDSMLSAVEGSFPALFPFVSQCYSDVTDLYYHDTVIPSQRGVQQGDPLAPALFSITIHPIVTSINTDLNVWYLDDGTIAGPPDDVLNALIQIREASAEVGLHLNTSKCEVSFLGTSDQEELNRLLQKFSTCAPGINLLSQEDVFLLGAPLTDVSMETLLSMKIEKLKFFLNRLLLLSAHSALFLLRASFSIPRIVFFLRCSPTWRRSACLQEFDVTLKIGLEAILNCALESEAWTQSSLPIKSGGLGIRRAADLAIPAFLASFHGSYRIVSGLLPLGMLDSDTTASEGESLWSNLVNSPPPVDSQKTKQHSWDSPMICLSHSQLSEGAPSPVEKARLLAVSSEESGSWLQVLPSQQLGLHLSDDCLRIAVAIRLGANVCHPHRCPCGSMVDARGLHGLSCPISAGRISRHSSVNDLILRALSSAGVPAVREPSGCCRSDGKRPDGLTLVPWKSGRSLLWDFSCSDTFAATYLPGTSTCAGHAARRREAEKKRKYDCLRERFCFVPVVIETGGTWGEEGLRFIKQIGHRLEQQNGDHRSTSFLLRRISLAVQRGNVASILGTLPQGKKLEEILLF